MLGIKTLKAWNGALNAKKEKKVALNAKLKTTALNAKLKTDSFECWECDSKRLKCNSKCPNMALNTKLRKKDGSKFQTVALNALLREMRR